MEINLINIKQAFLKMEKAWWDINKEKKWQYFFYSEYLPNLENIKNELIKKWYISEYIWKTEEDDFVLILSRIEILSPENLNDRNILLNELSLKFGIHYDWRDVENL